MSTTGNNSCNYNAVPSQLESCLFSLSPDQFSLLSSILGILLIDNLDTNQQNSLGNFIVGIGQAILTAAAQGQLLESDNSQNNDISQELEKLKKQVSALEKKL
ncbi:MAG: hypothetical protein ABRQ25_16955 [Clostridiaceae bacterium]